MNLIKGWEFHLPNKNISPSPDQENPICRRIYSGIKVDFMPMNEGILGFANRWCAAGFASAVPYALPNGMVIKILTLPYLLASKVEAFQGRGNSDFRSSPDMEDIVALIDGVRDFDSKMNQAPPSYPAFWRHSSEIS